MEEQETGLTGRGCKIRLKMGKTMWALENYIGLCIERNGRVDLAPFVVTACLA